jgi:hypothetical protein
MTDCINAEMRDMLPDLVSGSLGASETQILERHLDQCADCSAELELLRHVYALRPVAPKIDTARIVSMLPEPQVAKPVKRTLQLSSWRMAAGIAAIAVGGLSLYMGGNGLEGVSSLPLSDSLDDSASIASGVSGANANSNMQTIVGRPSATVAVSFGSLSDMTDDEVDEVISRLNEWDGATSTDPVTAMPIVTTRGGTSR